jgi:hypothetical protein
MMSKKEYAISPLQMNHSLGGLLYLYHVLNMSNCELHTYLIMTWIYVSFSEKDWCFVSCVQAVPQSGPLWWCLKYWILWNITGPTLHMFLEARSQTTPRLLNITPSNSRLLMLPLLIFSQHHNAIFWSFTRPSNAVSPLLQSLRL